MKKQPGKLILFLLSLILFISCEEAEIAPKEYPLIKMENIRVSPSGASFSAEVRDLGNQDIQAYGFVWGGRTDLDISIHAHKEVGNDLSIGTITLDVQSGLADKLTYYVRPYVQTEDLLVYGTVLSFTSQGSNPPEIQGFQPRSGSFGTVIEISGKNFGLSPQSNSVLLGEFPVEVDSVKDSKLFITVPKIAKPEEVLITIETANMKATSTNKFSLQFPWLKLAGTHELEFPAPSFTLSDKAYVFKFNSVSGTCFNSVTETWESFNLPPGAGGAVLGFSIADKGYILAQNGFLEYDPAIKFWAKKADFPDNIEGIYYVFAMGLEDKGLIGFCYKNRRVWSYNPSTDRWTRVADFPEKVVNSTVPVWGNFPFTIENKGYLGVVQSNSAIDTFWEYDPEMNTWTEKQSIPSASNRYFATMAIEGYGYVGLGTNSFVRGYVSNEIWRYDPATDNWIQYQNCPKSFEVMASFAIGSKGYIMSGFTSYYRPVREIWEFTPQNN